ncbi:MAG: hypothetical protein LBS72_03685 [Oscillospiraceae bacterium]|jgi:hypothetical protein|nr:hypothetical protein [Oscillospiraceae bacterium]
MLNANKRVAALFLLLVMVMSSFGVTAGAFSIIKPQNTNLNGSFPQFYVQVGSNLNLQVDMNTTTDGLSFSATSSSSIVSLKVVNKTLTISGLKVGNARIKLKSTYGKTLEFGIEVEPKPITLTATLGEVGAFVKINSAIYLAVSTNASAAGTKVKSVQPMYREGSGPDKKLGSPVTSKFTGFYATAKFTTAGVKTVWVVVTFTNGKTAKSNTRTTTVKP